ncbi:uncharacterized protein AMSG_11665 [Thecamonas trahens ATCC 50062]|uniref:phosphatidylinositol 3-kinase n=1 Tax=Thecamonas trahens ATCC 50062 TaxID=461836 RepID=A0A0L0DVE3_THETB|nr:hypothetical protein AMSG_11665 [Thecamonas trahens ATCC 50062]KNC55508.1 hypothetical protein AMSG_11665 [Thecamonas trahens ATCC 50062]|eukprot:XP_013761471.1 hypothetical protein AMSG_11665 [Thecamonas trahens ATCC 50062]
MYGARKRMLGMPTPSTTTNKTFHYIYSAEVAALNVRVRMVGLVPAWLEFPVRYADLPRSAVLVATLWNVAAPEAASPLGSAVFPLFRSNGVLAKGKHSLALSPAQIASPLHGLDAGFGSGRDVPRMAQPPPPEPGSLEATYANVAAGMRAYDQGDVPRVEWLDALAFEHVHALKARAQHVAGASAAGDTLVIELVTFDYPVLATPLEEVVELAGGPPPFPNFATNALVTVCDPFVGVDSNPVEAKHRRLARSHRKGFLDHNLKPNSAERRALHAIITAPPTAPISDEHSELLWKFRYALVSNPRALGPFLRTIEWSDPGEVDLVASLLPSWAPISVEQALELLLFRNPSVRLLALDVLQSASDEKILMYLLQLVQCLRYSPAPGPDSPLGRFLLTRALANARVGNFLVWYLQVECEDKAYGKMFHNFIVSFEASVNDAHSQLTLPATGGGSADPLSAGTTLPLPTSKVSGASALATSVADSTMGLFSSALAFVTGESSSMPAGDAHATSSPGSSTGGSASLSGSASATPLAPRYDMIVRQRNLLAHLNALYSELRKQRDRKKNITRLQQGLSSRGEFSELASFKPVELPLNPDIVVVGLDGAECTMLKSALTPLLLTFITAAGGRYKVLFKAGDDPRQDQLVIQLIRLMDSLLLKEALDLKLMPYSVLAASSNDGLIEFVDGSHNVSRVIKEHKAGILGFFRKVAPDPNGPYQISEAVLDTFARSCAGYSVITYILAVGDRHLDNLLLTDSGQLFHIDFGYILGKDPSRCRRP